MTCSVYKLTNQITGKSYIGVSVNPQVRFNGHCRSPDLIGKTIRKYGKENFALNTLLIADRDYCYFLESQCINAYQTRVPNGYNIAPGGNRGHDCTGRIHTLETKEKISVSHKGKKCAPFSEEHKIKLRLALKKAIAARTKESFQKAIDTKRRSGKIRPPISEETRRKISQAGMGRIPWNKGGKHSPETIQKLKDSSPKKRKSHSEETKRRIGMAIRLSFAKKRAKK